MQDTRKISFSPEEKHFSADDETLVIRDSQRDCFTQTYPSEEEATNNNDESCSQIKTKIKVQTYCPTSIGDDVYLAIETATQSIICSPASCGSRYTLRGTGLIGQLFRYSAPLRLAEYTQITTYNELGETTGTVDISNIMIGPTDDAGRIIAQQSQDASALSVTCF
jgi:hypothetical protein